MSNMEIVFLDGYTNNPGDISWEVLEKLGKFTVYDRTNLDELQSRAKDTEIIIVNKFVINEASLALMPKVKYIVVAATGYNNIDLVAVKNRNIPVSNVRGYSTESVTQHVFANIFALFNRIDHYNHEVKLGRWSKSPDFCFYDHSIRDISGLTFGIFGLGTIGKQVAKVAHAFGANVIASTRSEQKDLPDYIKMVAKDELFAKSDILSLHSPLTDETKGIVNKTNLKLMKSDAILINTSRGGLVVENDLFYALDHGVIAAAALDVLDKEPPHFTNPLVNHQRCIMTPHIAWASRNARIKLLDGIAENIVSYMNGIVLNSIY